jgi:hypothetical protein
MTEADNTKLYKTVVTIFTDYDPSNVELEHLAREATSGDAYCTGQETVSFAPEDFGKIEGVGEELFNFFNIEPPAWEGLGQVSPTTDQQHYLVTVVGDVEPEISGPYVDDAEQLRAARRHRLSDLEREDGLYRLRVHNGMPEIESFSGYELGDEDTYVICSDGERGYWSNEAGWVRDVASATYFADTERAEVTLPLPVDSRWVGLEDAENYQEET